MDSVPSDRPKTAKAPVMLSERALLGRCNLTPSPPKNLLPWLDRLAWTASLPSGDNYLQWSHHGHGAVYQQRDGISVLIWNEGTARDDFATTLLDAYQRSGRFVAGQLSGRFAFILVDTAQQLCIAATDHFGSLPLYFVDAGREGLLFATSARILATHPQLRTHLDPQTLYRYWTLRTIPSPHSIYKRIERLRPAETLQIQGGTLIRQNYWPVKFAYLDRDSNQAAGPAIEHALQAALKPLRGTRVGLMLDGGFNTSIIAHTLDTIGQRPLKSVAVGQPQDKGPLKASTGAASYYYSDHLLRMPEGEEIIAAVTEIAAISDQPLPPQSGLNTYFMMQGARHQGIADLISALGAAELFGGHRDYAVQAQLAGYANMPALLRKLLLELPLRAAALTGIAQLKRLAECSQVLHIDLPQRLIAARIPTDLCARKLFSKSLYRQVDESLDIQELQRRYHEPKTQSMLNRLLFLDWKMRLADCELTLHENLAAHFGIHCHHPFLSEKIVRESVAMAPSAKVRGWTGERLLHQHYAPHLPKTALAACVQTTRFDLAYLCGKSPPLRIFVTESLKTLNQRHLFDTRALEALSTRMFKIKDRASVDAMWKLLFLEQWLQHHPSRLVQQV